MKSLLRYYILTVLVISSCIRLSAQELNCTVEFNTDQIQNVNKEVFNTLKNAISEYVNNNKWSNASFYSNERIECRMYFTIKSYNDGNMIGDLQIQASRPVYNSSYTTTLLNFRDTQIDFNYQENDPLVFSENSMESNLTAILDFYCYLILGLDFDSFSPEGGSQFFDKAATVVNFAQSAGEKGWKAFEDNKNRAAVLSVYTDKQTAPIRDLIYTYHRKGLDEMSVSPNKGRAAITGTLENLKKVYDVAPMSVGLSMFKDAKLDELVNIYSKASTTEKDKVYELLRSIYPTENSRLVKIKEESK